MESLRAFEVAARALNFSRAAAELNLTQSAVSRAIRTLEERVGERLFERRHPYLALTTAGELLLRDCVKALNLLRESMRQIQLQPSEPPLVLRVPRGLAVGWLFSRVAAFCATHTTIDVRLSLAQRVGSDADRAMDDVTFASGSDLAIRLLPRTQAEGRWHRLLDEYVFPCCSPQWLPAERDGRQSIDTLVSLPILEYEDGLTQLEGNWRVWSRLVGVAPPSKAEQWLKVSDWQALFDLAARGKGVCLGRTPMISDLLRSGGLAAPSDTALRGPRAYYVIEPPGVARTPRLMTFAHWLAEEADAEQRFEAELLRGRHLIDSVRPS